MILSLGAINKKTDKYVYIKIANKKDEYICPECNKDVILCQGTIRVHHFRHKVDEINPCYHYSSPTETQLHKDAKQLMKSILDNKTPISFVRKCCCCKNEEEFEIPETSDSSIIQLEYRFEYHGQKVADVAYIEDGKLLCIFEICNTHKTRCENRPEPWFEIDAETLIRVANDNDKNGALKLPCIRCENCDECIQKENRSIDVYDFFYKKSHKNAKYKLASWLKEKRSIGIYRYCSKSKCDSVAMEYDFVYDNNDEVEIDYRDLNNKYIADVAVINNNKVKYVFEIKNTYSCITNIIPEPWCEIDAREVNNYIQQEEEGEGIGLTCIRNFYCDDCIILDEDWVNNLPRLCKRYGWNQQYKQEYPCIKCDETAYRPIFSKGYRQLCDMCLSKHKDELKKEYDMKGKCLLPQWYQLNV